MNRHGLRWIHAPEVFSPAPKPGPAQQAKNRLSTHNLCYGYSGEKKNVLKGVGLSGKGGEIIALTGGNGAGKSTLAMLLCGLFKARKGQIRINGKNRNARERLKFCRLVLQEADHQLFAETVFRELELGLDNAGCRSSRIIKLLEDIGLADKAHFRPQSLSGGEKQRLTVATALAAEPAVLILDEPTSGLDAGNMSKIGVLLKLAALRGSFVLVITHDEEFIQTCCTRVLHMEKGEITNA